MTRHADIEEVLTVRMGEYFRPGTHAGNSWRLNPADLSKVVADILGAAFEEMAEEVSQLLPNTDDQGYRAARYDAMRLLQNHAGRLHGDDR